MTDPDLLTLSEREIERLTAENDHGAAVIMRALVQRLRALTEAAKLEDTMFGRTFVAGGAGFGDPSQNGAIETTALRSKPRPIRFHTEHT